MPKRKREAMSGHSSGLPGTEAVFEEEDGTTGTERTLDFYLKLTDESMEAVQRMSSRHFNNEQCDYLVDKLKVVVQSASSFANVSRVECHGLCLSMDIAKGAEIFKLLLALAKPIESFVEGCCKDAWIQAAMTLTNVSEYVSSLGFNLELCRLAFCKECTAAGSLTLDEADDINKAEVENVTKRALVDVATLLAKVTLELSSLSAEKQGFGKLFTSEASKSSTKFNIFYIRVISVVLS